MAELIIPVVALIVVALITGIWFFILVSEEAGGEIKFVRRYALIMVLIFWLLGLFSLMQIENIRGAYLGFQIGFLLLGALHIWLLDTLHEWNKQEQVFTREFLFTLFITALGAAGFVAVFFLLKPLAGKMGIAARGIPTNPQARTVFNATPYLFLIPFFLKQAYDSWMVIPGRIYRQLMYYGNSVNLQAYDARHIKEEIRIHFLISMTAKVGERPQKVRATVDKRYQFGGFFHVFVAEYNRKNPMNPIRNLTDDSMGEPVSWLFYRHPRSWWQFGKYLDPAVSFLGNAIRSGDVIKAERALGKPEKEQILAAPPDPAPPSGKITIKKKGGR